MFTRTGSTWRQQAYLKASNAEAADSLGVIVSISDDGNTVAAGSLDEDCMATGVNPTQPCDNDRETDASVGAAYVFARAGEGWVQQAFIKSSNSGKEDWFGSRLQISGDGQPAVTAQLENSNARRDQRQSDRRLAQEAGALYLFSRAGTTWTQRAYVKGSNTEAFDEFGSSVAVSAATAARWPSGARGEDGGPGRRREPTTAPANRAPSTCSTSIPERRGAPVAKKGRPHEQGSRMSIRRRGRGVGAPPVVTAQGAQGAAASPGAGDQQTRGKALYTDKCSKCHQENLRGSADYPPLAGDAFWMNWETYTANNLLEQSRTTMPGDDPGSLPRETYVDIVAYILKTNGVTLTADLPTDADGLKKVILKKDGK